jgi:4-hydroxy-4-methyl-2-oxoglutarate aldolase
MSVQVPVSIGGMDVAPGEIIHMDENGAVKFPADKLEPVLTTPEPCSIEKPPS